MKHGWSNLKEVLQKTFRIREKVDMALTGLIIVPSESIYPLICKPLQVELLDQFKTWLSQLLEMEVGKEYVQQFQDSSFFSIHLNWEGVLRVGIALYEGDWV